MKKIIYYLFITLTFISCKEKVIRGFYDSGKLMFEKYIINQSNEYAYCKVYYENGKLRAEGPVLKNDYRTGHWKEYYNDGMLKWKGDFENGKIIIFKDNIMPDYEELETNLQVPNEIILGKSFSFRIYVESLHPQSYLVTLGHYGKIEYNESDTINYPYTISVEQIQSYHNAGYDSIDICIHFPLENGNIVIGESVILCVTMPIERDILSD